MKKVLIITYYWPPAGGPGVQRWLKFVKYLPEFGIQPVVYVPENPSYPILDENLLDEVPKDAIIIKKKIREPHGLASIFSKKSKKISSGIITNNQKQTVVERLLLMIRGNAFIPDARVLWVRPSVSFLKRYIAENKIETIITSGPPHSLHLIGMKLQQQLNITWIADFRDPWTTIGYHNKLKLSAFAHRKHMKLEQKVLRSADTILVTSKTTKSDFAKITKQPITVITNGYDTELSERQVLDSKFTIAHIGSFLSDRNPTILWQALAELVNEIPEFSNNFKLKLIGTVSAEIVESINKHQLAPYVNNLGYVQHSDAVTHQQRSQVLLLIEIDAEITKSIIPGKLFEYMASGRPILGIGPKGSDFADIISKTNTGTFFNYAEKERLKAQILQYYQLYKDGALTVNAVGLQQYSRKNLTGKLAEIINVKRELKL